MYKNSSFLHFTLNQSKHVSEPSEKKKTKKRVAKDGCADSNHHVLGALQRAVIDCSFVVAAAAAATFSWCIIIVPWYKYGSIEL